MENNKKIKIIITVVVIVVAVAIGVYFFIIKSGYKLPTLQKEVAPGLERIETSEGTVEGTLTPQGVIAAPGTSPVSTSTGKVVTPENKPVKLNVEPSSPEAPQQSSPLSKEQIPISAIKLTVSAAGFKPKEFSVKAGSAVTLSVTSGDSQTHVFMFDDPSLSAIAVGVGPRETRVITFNAPKSGEYAFHCDVPGHTTRGETGKMIVK